MASKTETKDLCPICQDDESMETMVSFPQCSHSVHIKCVLQYALYTGIKNADSKDEVSLLCPICRQEQVSYKSPEGLALRERRSIDTSGNHIIIVADQDSYDHLMENMAYNQGLPPNMKMKLWNIFLAVGITVLVVSSIQSFYASELIPP